MLFREIRLLTRSLKPAPWVPRVLQWFEEYLNDEDAQNKEVIEITQEMKEVYEFAKGAVGNTNKVSVRCFFLVVDVNLFDLVRDGQWL